MSRQKVLYLEPVHRSGMEFLQKKYDVVVASDLTAGAFDDILSTAEALVTRLAPVGAQILDQAPCLRAVGRHGVGVDNIDTDLTDRRGIKVITTGDANALSVAEHTITAIGALFKQALWFDRQVRIGQWAAREDSSAREVAGKRIGVVGLGEIGRHVARMASQGLGMQVLYFDPHAPAQTHAFAAQRGYRRSTDLEELARAVDVLTVHMPLTDETRGIIDDRLLHLLGQRSFVVNFARGGIVDEEALVRCLRDGAIGGAALDVFENEPISAEHPLTSLDNVVLSPHCSFLTEESLVRMSMAIAQGIDAVLSEPQRTETRPVTLMPNGSSSTVKP